VERFDGHSFLTDRVRGEAVNNWIAFEVGVDVARFYIGGSALLSRPTIVESQNRFVIRALFSVIKTLRREAYMQRKIVPVPKPTSRKAPLRDQQLARNGGPCRWCGGSGEYEGKDGCWVECQHCQPFPASDDED
jgi:hypothetical protein